MAGCIWQDAFISKRSTGNHSKSEEQILGYGNSDSAGISAITSKCATVLALYSGSEWDAECQSLKWLGCNEY